MPRIEMQEMKNEIEEPLLDADIVVDIDDNEGEELFEMKSFDNDNLFSNYNDAKEELNYAIESLKPHVKKHSYAKFILRLTYLATLSILLYELIISITDYENSPSHDFKSRLEKAGKIEPINWREPSDGVNVLCNSSNSSISCHNIVTNCDRIFSDFLIPKDALGRNDCKNIADYFMKSSYSGYDLYTCGEALYKVCDMYVPVSTRSLLWLFSFTLFGGFSVIYEYMSRMPCMANSIASIDSESIIRNKPQMGALLTKYGFQNYGRSDEILKEFESLFQTNEEIHENLLARFTFLSGAKEEKSSLRILFKNALSDINLVNSIFEMAGVEKFRDYKTLARKAFLSATSTTNGNSYLNGFFKKLSRNDSNKIAKNIFEFSGIDSIGAEPFNNLRFAPNYRRVG